MRRLAILAIGIAAAAATAAGQANGFTITTPSLPPAIVGQTYTPVILQTANGPGPVAWDFSPAGSGPFGFVIGPGPFGQPDTTGTFCNGFLTQNGPPLCNGTVQTPPNVYTVVVKATALSTGQTATRQYSFAVVQPLQIATTAITAAAAGKPYSFQLQATGGAGPLIWSVTTGALPPGIGLASTTGVLSGTPPTVNASYTFVIQVFDQGTQTSDVRQFTMDVAGGLAILTTALPNALLNKPYSFQLEGAGAANPHWALQQGSPLPLSFQLSTSGVLSGSPQNTGKFVFTVEFTDEQIPGLVTRTFTLSITLGPLGIQEKILPNATQNVAYQATLTPFGGLPPYTWSFDFPNPQGLTIGTDTGTISGTPTKAGVFTIPVSLHDSSGDVFSQAFTLSVGTAVSITKTSLSNGSPGTAYSDTVTATGGVLTYSWDVIAGSLPTGLALDKAKGQISGTPTTQGTFTFTIQVTDFVGGKDSKVFTITIGAGLVITTASLPDGALNQPYSQTLVSTGGLLPLTWSIASGTLPPGLTLDAATGVISGTPSTVGNSPFDVLVTDARQSVARKSFVINIANPVVITSGDFIGTVLSAFSQTLTATGGTPPYTWSVTAGSLPAGLQLSSATGVISGTPTEARGITRAMVTATDTNSRVASKEISITINLPPIPPTSITLGSTTQPAVNLSIGASFPLDITGVLTLTFASSAGGTDDMVRFSNGTRSLAFTVPANTTQATFQTASPAILTGTVAGTITLTASMSSVGQNITPSPAPTRTITIDPSVPVLNSVTLQQVSGGVSVVVSGYSNTREVSSGSFTFTVSSGNTLSVSTLVVSLTSSYATWFNSTASNATGGQFKLTVPFNVTGSATAITKVTVTLTNSKGASAAASSP